MRTDLQNLFREIFFKDFSDTLWVENMFKPIRAIDRTDSEVIWTRICEDIAILEKFPDPPLKEKNHHMLPGVVTFHWEKINIIAVLDHFFIYLKVCSKMMNFAIFRAYRSEVLTCKGSLVVRN